MKIALFILIIYLFIGYLIGSFSMSNLISKKKGINLKEQGSKNLGTSNTIALIGVKEGIIVLLSDILKALIAMLGLIFINNYLNINLENISYVECTKIDLMSMIGMTTIFGHIFPIYLNFDGGKGFATYIGTLLTLSFTYPSLLLILIIALILAFATDYIVIATFTIIALTPLYFLFINTSYTAFICFLIASIIILIKHIDNIKRISNKTEMRIRAAFKKEYKEKGE